MISVSTTIWQLRLATSWPLVTPGPTTVGFTVTSASLCHLPRSFAWTSSPWSWHHVARLTVPTFCTSTTSSTVWHCVAGGPMSGMTCTQILCWLNYCPLPLHEAQASGCTMKVRPICIWFTTTFLHILNPLRSCLPLYFQLRQHLSQATWPLAPMSGGLR